MKKLLLASLLLSLLVSCSGSAESPIIEITGLFIGDDTKDYSKDMASIPSLKVGDEMTISLRLDGNGEDLNTFIVKEEAERLGIDLYLPDGVSSGSELSKPENGVITFKDGIQYTDLKVKVGVKTVADADAILAFYLSSKAECESAQEKIELKTEATK